MIQILDLETHLLMKMAVEKTKLYLTFASLLTKM
jgi:hypothetical protein